MANHTDALMRSTSMATGRADDLSLRLHYLTEIVKLAAFAADMRSTLEGINDAMHYQPEMQEIIHAAVPCSRNWTEMEDSTSKVLTFMAREMEAVKDAFTNTVYELARAADAEAEKIGGAA